MKNLKRKEPVLGNTVLFQWIDVDVYLKDEKPVFRFFGVSDQGNSVLCHVKGFVPYFYCEIPENFTKENFIKHIEGRKASASRFGSSGNAIVKIETVMKKNLFGYNETAEEVYKVYLKNHLAIASVRKTILNLQLRTFESQCPIELRFMVDNEIVGGNWLETDNFNMVRKKISTCQIEMEVMYENLRSIPVEKKSSLADLRVLSFDIECKGRKGVFPEAKIDPVIQISSYVAHQNTMQDPFIKTIFVLDSCDPISGAEVRSFKSERELLMAWSKFVTDADPDIFTGYNIQNFDFKYLLDRAKILKIDAEFSAFTRIIGTSAKIKQSTFTSSAYGTRDNSECIVPGRIVMDMISYMYRNHKLSSYSLNSVSSEILNETKEDVHHSIISKLQDGTSSDRHRLAVYCLKDAYLPLRLMDKLKVVINYIEMARVTGVPVPFLFSRGQQIKVMSMLYRKARTEGLIIPVLSNQEKGGGGGDGVGYEGATVLEPRKGFYNEPIATLDFASLYPSIMMAHNLCYTTLLGHVSSLSDLATSASERYRNKDLSTDKLREFNLTREEVEVTPTGHVFLSRNKKKGLLPTILEELLSARKQAKKDMKNADNEFDRAVMNGRQLALKVSANSVYGFTGATVGQLPCIPISASTTAYGREMIEATKNFVEQHSMRELLQSDKNSYVSAEEIPQVFPGIDLDRHPEVIYGDTDSVMVKFGFDSIKKAMILGKIAASMVSDIFPSPIFLEFEKVYSPYLLMNKKRYAGLIYTDHEGKKYDKMDFKGLENVRRDNCRLVRLVMDTNLRKLLIERSVKSAIDYTKQTISALLQNKVDISLLIITKSLSKNPLEELDAQNKKAYAAKQAHVELAKRMYKRDPGSAPVVGDRVPYVVISGSKNTPLYERAEDPLYALENSIPIDYSYYLENQLAKPLERLFEGVISGNVHQKLFSGEHTHKIIKPTREGNVGIMKFAVKGAKCVGCKATLKPWKQVGMKKVKVEPKRALCENCEKKRNVLLFEKQENMNKLTERFSKLWTQCQRCQGSLHQEVICSSKDCPIFYMRRKVQKDIKTVQDVLERFEY
eukprot:maker-scaffold_3-snap-gene-9.49-mRNA-1 protein AED:0.01 eAED:0.01 QI:0/0/0/1/1/1/3/0/1065